MTKTSSHGNHSQWHLTCPIRPSILCSPQQICAITNCYEIGTIVDKMLKCSKQTYHWVKINCMATVIFLLWFQHFRGNLHKQLKPKLINYSIGNVTKDVALISPRKTSLFYLPMGTPHPSPRSTGAHFDGELPAPREPTFSHIPTRRKAWGGRVVQWSS